jgi:hypothetical protein
MLNLDIAKTYAEVTPAPILHLHRHQDGYIAFAAERDGDDFRPLVAIRAGELENWFPLFRDQFLKDAYVGINADWQLRSYGADGNSYGYPLHRSDRLRYINAAYVDIDYYKLGLDLGTVIGRVINLQDSGQLPHASILVKSGQGLWLLWLIHDPRSPELSSGAFPDKLELYARIQDAIIERLLPLGADQAARDAARHIRLPGSLHGGAGAVVEWWIQGRSQGGYVYTLQELASLLKATPTRRHGREIIAHNPRKRRGWVALNARRLRDFNTLRGLRGGFSEGCRNNAAKIYAWLLRCNAIGGADVYGLVGAMAGQCRPRLDRSAVKAAVEYSRAMRRMKDQTIADWLGVTRPEAEMLEGLPPASGYRAAEDAALGPMPRQLQRQAVMDRRCAIQAVIAEIGAVPSVRAMAGILGSRGYRGNRQTVFDDYRALGVEWERTRKARAEKKQPGNSLFYCLQELVDKTDVLDCA